MLMIERVEEVQDSIAAYAKDYETVSELIDGILTGDIELFLGGTRIFMNITDIFPDSNHLQKILHDLEVYQIELRREIRDVLDMDEEEQTGIITGKRQAVEVYPKADYRRHVQEEKEDDLK